MAHLAAPVSVMLRVASMVGAGSCVATGCRRTENSLSNRKKGVGWLTLGVDVVGFGARTTSKRAAIFSSRIFQVHCSWSSR